MKLKQVLPNLLLSGSIAVLIATPAKSEIVSTSEVHKSAASTDTHVSLTQGTPLVTNFRLVKPVREIRRVSEIERPIKSAQMLLGQSPTPVPAPSSEVVQVTVVKANPTDKGVEVILQTAKGQQLQVVNRSTGNNFIADIPNAQLRLPSGEAFTFRSDKPIAGITEITVTNFDANTIRLTVTGEAGVPTVELFDSPDEGIIFSVASAAPSTQPRQQPQTQQKPEQEQPMSETQPSQPSTQGDEPIELVVTGEQDGYRVPNTSTATKTDTPLRDIPASIQVIPRQVLDDQQATTLTDALRNVSGVRLQNTGGATTEQFNIRGFSTQPLFQDGLRLPFVTGLLETAHLERVEVLKGPASILFGQVQPGGIINQVTKKPLADPFYSVGMSIGSYSFYRPTIDFSGPLTADRSLRYRLNLAYENAGSFRDFYQSERFFVSPVLTWDISKSTNLTLLAEYLYDKGPLDRGLIAFGRGIADIPFSRRLDEPFNETPNESIKAAYILEHRFSDDWLIRNAFQAFTNDQSGGLQVQATGLNERTGILQRQIRSIRPLIDETYSLQTDLVGNFATGSVKHKLLFGIELARDTRVISFQSAPVTPISIFNPVYGTFQPFVPPIVSASSDARNRLGIYLQDQITLAENLKLLVGGRFDIVDLESLNKLTGRTTEQYDDAFSPRIGIVYQPILPLSLYASFSQSFVPNSASRADGSFLEPESGTQYEIGIKGEFLDSKLSATLAAYEITKTNVATVDPNNSSFFLPVGEQRSRGIELDVVGEILPGWNIIASYAYTDAEVTKDNNRTLVGNRLLGVPKHGASLWTTYTLQSGDLKGLGFGAGVFFVGDRFGDLDNSFVIPNYVRTDAALYYRRGNVKIAFNFKNLFDVRYIEASSFRTGVTPGIPFTAVGSVSLEF